MATYLVSYDLVGKEEDYKTLLDALRRDGAVKILYSEWVVQSSLTAKAVAEKYLAYMDNNDRLFVVEILAGRFSYYRLMNQEQALRLMP